MKTIIFTLLVLLGSSTLVHAEQYNHSLFSITYPAGWKYSVDKYPSITEVTFTKNETDGSISGLTIQIISSKQTLEEIEREELGRISQAKEFQFLSSHGPTSLAGEPAVQFTRSIDTKTLHATQVDYFMQKSGHLIHLSYVIEYNIVMQVMDPSYIAYRKQFEEMLKSFKFK